jgi:hypothetical protein
MSRMGYVESFGFGHGFLSFELENCAINFGRKL